MKNLIILLLTLNSVHSFCQESDVFTARQVEKIAVFPGCEKFTSNEDLLNCFRENLNKQLEKNLNREIDYFLSLRMENLITKIQFVISKDGEFKYIESLGGNQELSVKAVDVFNKSVKRIIVAPAYIENKKPVNLVFQLPVKYSFFDIWKKENEIFENLGAKEIVYVTLNDSNEKYEIRLKKDLTFSVYNLKNNQEEFLGNVPNWLEFQNMKPFAKYVNTLLEEQQWELMTEGNLDGETYRIYRWSYDLEYVRVYQLVNGEEELVLKSNRFSKFKKSPYLKLLYR